MCTSFRLTASDGATAIGRTMEFPNLLQARIALVPRDTGGGSVGPNGAGKSWTSRYGFVGVDVFGDPQKLTDGMNEAGLYVNLQYMPGFCDYEPTEGVPADRLVAPPDLVGMLLGACSSVTEVRTAMASTVVWSSVFGPFGYAPPVHVVVHDKQGNCVVIEWAQGHQVVFDNPYGVATNSPHFDWHLINLRNYLKLDTTNPKPVTIDGVTLSPMGQGGGMTGLPGDSTSPSRFVRAVAYTSTLRPIATGADAEVAALHVLDNFDIPWGMDRENDDRSNDDHTLWSTIANLTDGAYILRTYLDPVPRRIQLADIDFAASPVTTVPLPSAAEFPRMHLSHSHGHGVTGGATA
jgi:choloylglycine hydrolase